VSGNQGFGSIAIGQEAQLSSGATGSIAIGYQAGYTGQGGNTGYAVAIGYQAGQTGQAERGVAMGYQAGASGQNPDAIAIGSSAGYDFQGENAIAMGFGTGQYLQGGNAVAIGNAAGLITQSTLAVAIGTSAGQITQSSAAVAIGYSAGNSTQGSNAIAIGQYAGYSSQAANSIILNASGVTLNSATFGFYVNPVGSSTDITLPNTLYYDTLSSEIKYSTGKTFVIDHPLDQSKYLVHACLEGPEAGVYYRGKGEIIDNKSVSITLPDYVSALATDLTVQITPIYNGKINVLNASEIENNSFTVYGESSCKFHWTVYGKRGAVRTEPFKNDVSVKGSGPYLWI
jgi:hypothetical protein